MVRNSLLASALLMASLALSAQPLDSANLSVGEPLRHERLTLFPVAYVSPPPARTEFILLDEGLEAGTVVITEIGGEAQTNVQANVQPLVNASSEESRNRQPAGEEQSQTSSERVQQVQQLVQQTGGGAQVNTLVIRNDSDLPLFLLAGEMIRGAKQDRIIAHDVVIPPGSKEVPLDVFCVESGRWVHESESFASAKTVAGANVRSTAQVEKAQQSVWDQVATYNKAVGARTDTGTLRAAFEQEDVQEATALYRDALEPQLADRAGLAGVIVAIDDRIVVADIFGVSGLFDRLREKLMTAYILDAVSAPEGSGTLPPTRVQAEEYLEGILRDRGRIDSEQGEMEISVIEGEDRRGTRATYRDAEIHVNSF